jgi:putative hydrolase of the HAD superfamily
MIKNVIFDFGRVIVDFDEFKMARAYIEDERDARLVRDVVFDRLYWDPLDSGDISDEEVKAGIASRLPDHLVSSAHRVYDHWIEHVDVLPGIEDAILTAKECADGIYLLSNINCFFAENYTENPTVARIFSQFDGLVFSGPLHLVKPDPRIFRYLLERYGLVAEECLFIDDSEKNTAAAEVLGIKTYLFDGDAAKLKHRLKLLFASK